LVYGSTGTNQVFCKKPGNFATFAVILRSNNDGAATMMIDEGARFSVRAKKKGRFGGPSF
jgi:hypothetical protein